MKISRIKLKKIIKEEMGNENLQSILNQVEVLLDKASKIAEGSEDLKEIFEDEVRGMYLKHYSNAYEEL